MDMLETPGEFAFGEMVRMLRQHKGIRQQDLADRLDLHRNTIGAWERGEYLPDCKSLVLELAKLLGLNEQETRQLIAASLTTVVQRWNVPYQRNRYFTGRSSVLKHIHAQLSPEQKASSMRCCAVSGLAGMGKTQVAVEYAYRHATAYSSIFWVNAENEASLHASFGSLARLLGLPEQHICDQHRLVDAILRWLNGHRDWLLIMDNVERVETVAPYIPGARHGALLITTRLPTLGTLAPVIELAPLSKAEGTRFLLRRVGRQEAANREPLQDNEIAISVVELLGGLPLALDHAGAYIEETGCEIAHFLHLLRQQPVSLLDECTIGTDQKGSVAQTLLLLFKRLCQKNVDSSLLLTPRASLSLNALPEEFLHLLAGALRKSGTQYYLQGRYEEALSLLQQALTIQERTLQPEHLDVRKTCEHYTALLAHLEPTNEEG